MHQWWGRDVMDYFWRRNSIWFNQFPPPGAQHQFVQDCKSSSQFMSSSNACMLASIFHCEELHLYLSELQNVSLSIAKFICPNCRVHIYFYIHKFTNALSPLPSWRVNLEWQCKQLHLQVPVGCNIEKISVKFVLYCLSRCQWGATGHVKKISGR